MEMQNIGFRLAVGIALLLGLQISVSAQVIYGTVKNMLTGEVLIGAKVTLARQDSSAIDSSVTIKDMGVYDRRNVFFFHNAPKEGGHWLLKVEKEGYQTEWFAINVPRFSVRRSLYFAGDLMIRRAKEHTLKDVTVHATKLKFYNHGDTLVYNADAFNLTEGSMLGRTHSPAPRRRTERRWPHPCERQTDRVAHSQWRRFLPRQQSRDAG